MHLLPSVFATREIRWRLTYMHDAPPVHTYVDRTTRSIKERIDFGYRASGRKRDAIAIGAKLKFDPFGYTAPSAFAALGEIIEDDVHVVFLRRRYFDIFATWKAFGIRHLANPNAKVREKKRPGGAAAEDARINRFHSLHGLPLEQKSVCITDDGGVLARVLRNRLDAGQILHCSAGDAIDELLGLFYNDVLGLAAVSEHARIDILYYEDIRSRFFSVTEKLGLGISEGEAIDLLDNAPTLQIEPPDAKLVFPDKGLKAVSNYLDATFNRIRARELAASDVIRTDEAEGSIEFYLPELASILEQHPETRALLRPEQPQSMSLLRKVLARTGRAGRGYPLGLRVFRGLFADMRSNNEVWVARRPMYTPVLAPPPPAPAPDKKVAAT
jgi:hypothetical protein